MTAERIPCSSLIPNQNQILSDSNSADGSETDCLTKPSSIFRSTEPSKHFFVAKLSNSSSHRSHPTNTTSNSGSISKTTFSRLTGILPAAVNHRQQLHVRAVYRPCRHKSSQKAVALGDLRPDRVKSDLALHKLSGIPTCGQSEEGQEERLNTPKIAACSNRELNHLGKPSTTTCVQASFAT